MADVPEDVQRWTAKRRVALVLSIVRGETSVAEAARKHGLTVAEVEEWQERFVAAAENALRSRPKDDEALKDEQIKKLKQKVGELVLDLDISGRRRRAALRTRRRPASEGGHAERLRASGLCRDERAALGGTPAAGDAPRPGRGRGPRPATARLIAEHPTFGYRRLWALLRFHEGLRINRKAVYRVLVLKGWFVHQRRTTPRPRVQGRRSRASRSNERWAMDVTHIDCGSDGWCIWRP